MGWFSVKTLIRQSVYSDKHGKDISCLEERVVLFSADSHEDALKMAKEDNEEYISDDILNPYQERVRYSILGVTESFELFESPSAGVELYSQLNPIIENVTDEKLVEMRFGKAVDEKEEREIMFNFRDSEFNT